MSDQEGRRFRMRRQRVLYYGGNCRPSRQSARGVAEAIEVLRQGDLDCLVSAAHLSKRLSVWYKSYYQGKKTQSTTHQPTGQRFTVERTRTAAILAQIAEPPSSFPRSATPKTSQTPGGVGKRGKSPFCLVENRTGDWDPTCQTRSSQCLASWQSAKEADGRGSDPTPRDGASPVLALYRDVPVAQGPVPAYRPWLSSLTSVVHGRLTNETNRGSLVMR